MQKSWRQDYQRYKKFLLDIYRLYQKRPDVKMYLEIIYSLITISLLTFFAIRPTALTISQLLKDIKAKEETLQKLNKKIEDIEEAQGVYGIQYQNLALLDESVSKKPNPEILTRHLAFLSFKNSIKILGINIDEITIIGQKQKKEKGDKGFFPPQAQEINFSISLEGDFPKIFSFIKDVENLRIPVKIEEVNLSQINPESGPKEVLILSGKIPYLKENK